MELLSAACYVVVLSRRDKKDCAHVHNIETKPRFFPLFSLFRLLLRLLPSSPPPLPSILFASQKAKLDFCTILCPVGLAEAEGASLLPLLSPPRSPQLYQRPTFQAKCDLVAPSSVARSLARSTADIAAFWWTHKRAQKKVSLRSEGFLLLLGQKKRKSRRPNFTAKKLSRFSSSREQQRQEGEAMATF